MKQYLGSCILSYLKFFAKLQLRKKLFDTIIGITGSVGKSSTRNAIYTVLKQKYRIKASFKANSESGIPLDILGLSMRDYSIFDWLRVMVLAPVQLLTNFKRYDYYIVEMGIDSPFPPKNMSYLLSIIQPDIGIFTSQGLNHAFAFDPLLEKAKFTSSAAKQAQLKQLIAKEKGKLLMSLQSNGLAIFNNDDENVRAIGRQSQGQKLTFGFGANADITCQKHTLQWNNNTLESSFAFRLKTSGGYEEITISSSNYLLFAEYAYNLAPAIIIGHRAGLSMTNIKKALEQELALPSGRASILIGKNQSLIIDSSYNASGMLDMLRAFTSLKSKSGRKLALLGDMRELGESTADLHQQVAQLLMESDIDQVFLVGESMGRYVLPLLQKNKITVQHFPHSVAAGQVVAAVIRKNDLLLVKGSQNTIFLEDAIIPILANPERDRNKLCRQELSWQKRKQR